MDQEVTNYDAAKELLGGDDDREPKEQSQATRLIGIVVDSEAVLFTDAQGEAYIAINGDGTEIQRMGSRKTKRWLSLLYFKQESRAPSSEAINSAILTLEAMADAEGPTLLLDVRTAWRDGVVWYDLGRAVVRIDRCGWAVEERPPILFKRFAHQLPQVLPRHDGDFENIMDFLPLETGSDEALLEKVWIIAGFSPDGDRPINDKAGPQGSGKSTMARIEKRLLDPSVVETVRRLSDLSALQQHLSHTWLLSADNLSGLSVELSDMLSAAVTGDAVMRRKLFTNEDEQIFAYRRLLSLNGIGHTAERPDILDRVILFTLKRIDSSKRRDEASFWEEFNAALPSILGGALDILSAAIGLLPDVKLASKPRMADFARWGYAVAEAAGWGGNQFLAAYERNIGRQHEEAISASVLAQAIVQFMEEQESWSGKASELKIKLDEIARSRLAIDPQNRRTGWPQDAPRLSKETLRMAETLAAIGIEVSRGWQGNSRAIHIRRIENTVGTVGAVGFSADATNGRPSDVDGTVGAAAGSVGEIQTVTDSTYGADGKVASSRRRVEL